MLAKLEQFKSSKACIGSAQCALCISEQCECVLCGLCRLAALGRAPASLLGFTNSIISD